jgi:catechol 2,3-dioxygenase-like lactoylglutathione lyase family enzyme
MFSQVFPILVTRDLDASLAFYRDLLGAGVEYQSPKTASRFMSA